MMVVGPWILFTVLFGMLSFTMHYNYSALCWFTVIVAVVVVLLTGFFAYKAWRKRRDGEASREPSWFIFLFFSLLVVWILAVLLGSINYMSNMRPYYDYTVLNTYPAIDPARTEGRAVMDAGRVMFVPGARLDVSKAAAFKDGTVYCVAPVSSGTSEPLARVDFWAVGLNCCSGAQGDFECGAWSSPTAAGGLRWTGNDAARAYFRLAVEQAAAAHHLQVGAHPIYIEWMQDPTGAANAYQDRGLRTFVFWELLVLGLQLFFVGGVLFKFWEALS